MHLLDDQRAGALISKLHQEAQTQSLPERSLRESEARLCHCTNSIVLPLEGDLRHHLGVLSMRIRVFGVLLVAMQLACDCPCFICAILANEPAVH